VLGLGFFGTIVFIVICCYIIHYIYLSMRYGGPETKGPLYLVLFLLALPIIFIIVVIVFVVFVGLIASC